MDKLQTITKVTKTLGVSTRMLRYYEQLGLLQSCRMEGYSYRVYDEEACLRLNQILILRKLRIPLKQIGMLLTNEDAVSAINILMQNIKELNSEIDSLSTIRTILNRFVDELREKSGISLATDLLSESTLLSMIVPLSPEKLNFKEEKSMEDLKKASEKLNKLTDKDVRIIYLPPTTVAAYQYVGDEPEMHCNEVIDRFVRETGLIKIKPDIRHFGFNAPNPVDDTGYHGYEMWVTIPDDMEVTEPIVKKQFEGGLYAAHMIPFGAFEEWGLLSDWVSNNPNYEGNSGTKGHECMWGLLEEHLNYVNHVGLPNTEPEGLQLDLLMPIKPRFAAGTRHPQERIIETFIYNCVPVEVVEWSDTIWCGKIGYAENNTDEPNVDAILKGFMSLDIAAINERIEPDWDVCMSVNYFTKERPNGVMFGELVGTEHQHDGFDVYKLPAGQYLRIEINDESAKALGSQPWNGGIPPYEWIGEQLAPQFGYQYGNDCLPVFEYYGYYKPDKNAHEFRYLYVPVEKTG